MEVDDKIEFQKTSLDEYTKIAVLGKGTYGEVHKCIHNPTDQIVAMKTFMFEVSDLISVSNYPSSDPIYSSSY